MATTNSAIAKVLPAHETKHLPLLVYPIRDNLTFELAQSDDGQSNGTALWLGAQILSAFLADTLPVSIPASRSLIKTGPAPSVANTTRQARRPRAIELGSGVGLSALSLAAQGWSVLATDTPTVVNSVLRPNILRNTQYTRLPGSVQVRALDWTVPPEEWMWTDPLMVADHLQNSESRNEFQEVGDEELLGPPFDLILTSDTVYTPSLVAPLLRTLKHLICISMHSSTLSTSTEPKSHSKHKKPHPPLFLALEARDPDQIAFFFSQARDTWGLAARRVPASRVRRAMTRAGLGDWKREDWEGVEIWRMHLLDSDYGENNETLGTAS